MLIDISRMRSSELTNLSWSLQATLSQIPRNIALADIWEYFGRPSWLIKSCIKVILFILHWIMNMTFLCSGKKGNPVSIFQSFFIFWVKIYFLIYLYVWGCLCECHTHICASACARLNRMPNSLELKLGKVVSHQTDPDAGTQTWCSEKQDVFCFFSFLLNFLTD